MVSQVHLGKTLDGLIMTTTMANDDLAKAPVWEGAFEVQSYDSDFHGAATLEALCRYFQEGAWNHAEALGVGFHQLKSQDCLWVLSRLLVEVHAYPRWGDTVRLRTWPRPSGPLLALRDFEILSAAGDRLAAGSSAWLILRASSRRPQRLDRIRPDFSLLPEFRALARDPEKIRDVEPARRQQPMTVRYSDLDVNNHVNNARYIGWILDSYPVAFHRDHTPNSLEANYVGETTENDSVVIATQETEPLRFHHMVDKENGKMPVCRSIVSWQKRR